MSKQQLINWINSEKEDLLSVAQALWETPELGMQENKSAELLADHLNEEGFDLQIGVGDLSTALIATYGEEDPTIGIVAEYDALPSLSQKAKPERDPIEDGDPGHGCGHNLFAAGSLGGAIAVKRAIEQGLIDGTIVFYGCPAEETLVGKVYMAREGVFSDLDAALGWHPSHLTYPWVTTTLALDSFQFTFEGDASHAAASPESGRSALDAVQLLNTGVEYMREHISDEARVHYSIVDGGKQPNVVPPTASVWYYVRAPTREEVERISDWLRDIAEGAAQMTQTTHKERYLTGVYPFLPNKTITETINRNLNVVEPPNYTEDDREFADNLKQTISESKRDSQLVDVPEEIRDDLKDHILHTQPIEAFNRGTERIGSSDVGDVSQIAPMGQFRAVCWPIGTPAHTWQAVAANGGFGQKGAVYASKILAATAYDLLADPDLIEQAKRDFETDTNGREYATPLPETAEPPSDLTKR